MRLKESDVKEKGWKMLVALFKVAKADKQITPDEEAILETADVNVMNLLEYVKRAWLDNHLDNEEKERIEGLVAKIEDDATTVAALDSIITNEEADLIEVIRDTVREFFENEYNINF